MEIFNTVASLKNFVAHARAEGKTIGLVPTMGALHRGHISLIHRAVAECDICVASVFVNPTQFNDKRDLECYPRTPEADAAVLAEAGCHAVFMPSVEEVYPEPDTRVFDLGSVAEVMEGKHRPGHFNGVAQVVSKLFMMVEPDKAYFGEKDFQQIAVIRSMVNLLGLPVTIVACPTIREEDGLALSSRNVRLGTEERAIAPSIARILGQSRTLRPAHTPEAVTRWVTESLNALPHLQVEYFEIVDGNSLQKIDNWQDTDHAVGCITVYCGEVRLIDNIKYED